MLDVHLSRWAVARKNYQSLALSALMLAAKYEEVAPPSFTQFAELVKELASKEKLLEGEETLLAAMEFAFCPASMLTLFDEFAEELLDQQDGGGPQQLWKEKVLSHALLDVSLVSA